MKICKVCNKEIIKSSKESYKQYSNRVTCSIACQAKQRIGKPLKESTKAKISKSKIGNSSLSEVSRKKISDKMKGRRQTKQHIANSMKARGFKEELINMTQEEKSEYRYFYNLKRKFNLSKEDYYEMLKKQNNVCFICNKPNKQKRRLCVDHCHKTGIIRGLLCVDCNVALGNVNDDVNILYKMIDYLTK